MKRPPQLDSLDPWDVLNEPTGVAADAATVIFNLSDYRVISTSVTVGGRREVIVETDQLPGCPPAG
jgi:hypothetical protein